MRRFHTIGSAFLLVLFLFSNIHAADPTDPPIKKAIQAGVDSLRRARVASEEVGLVAYAMMKADVKHDDPVIVAHIKKIKARVTGKGYIPTRHHVYEASVDLMALEADDPKVNLAEITAIADYIMKQQFKIGCWDYPDAKNARGDTSITQYAILGLWAAKRAGLDVPLPVFDRATVWHLQTQLQNGAYCYHPADERAPAHSMTVAGVSDVLVARLFLHPGAGGVLGEAKHKKKPEELKREFKVLEQIDFNKKVEDEAKKLEKKAGGVVSLKAINASANRGLKWMETNFTIKEPKGWPIYYLYGLERMCTLAGVDKLGDHDWYAEGAEYLVANQNIGGGWKGWTNETCGTAFAVLFLTRATKKFVRPGKTIQDFGTGEGGLNYGSPFEVTRTEKQIDLSINELLRELGDPSKLTIIEVQAALIAEIQVGSREELIGQKDLLVKLALDNRIEVRRMAMWALGRCDDIRLVPVLLKGIQDSSLSVVIEARDALCCLSRRPLGFGLAADPRATIPVTHTDQQKKAAIAQWNDQLIKRWSVWYLRVRPYSERDDLLEVRLSPQP